MKALDPKKNLDWTSYYAEKVWTTNKKLSALALKLGANSHSRKVTPDGRMGDICYEFETSEGVPFKVYSDQDRTKPTVKLKGTRAFRIASKTKSDSIQALKELIDNLEN